MRATQADRFTWEYFLVAFQNKYVGKHYVEVRHLEFIELKQRDRLVAEFLRFSCYAQGIVTTKQDKCVREWIVIRADDTSGSFARKGFQSASG